MKKFFAFLFIFIMLLNLFPAAVFADDEESESDVILDFAESFDYEDAVKEYFDLHDEDPVKETELREDYLNKIRTQLDDDDIFLDFLEYLAEEAKDKNKKLPDMFLVLLEEEGISPDVSEEDTFLNIAEIDPEVISGAEDIPADILAILNEVPEELLGDPVEEFSNIPTDDDENMEELTDLYQNDTCEDVEEEAENESSPDIFTADSDHPEENIPLLFSSDIPLFDNPLLYDVIIDPNIENGYVEARPLQAEEGTAVSLRYDPDFGYVLTSLTVFCDDVPVELDGDSFIMPAGDVFVSATFTKHDHGNWIFTSSGEMLTATCGNEGCTPLPVSASLTLTADGGEYTGNPYAAIIDEEELQSWINLLGEDSVPEIMYHLIDEEEKTSDAPIEAGTYIAEITGGDQTAKAEFTITMKMIDKPTADPTEEFVYSGELQTYHPANFSEETMEITGNQQTAANESGYVVAVTLKDTRNTAWSTEGDCSFSWIIHKADYKDVTKTASGSILKPEGNIAEIVLPEIPDGTSFGIASTENTEITLSPLSDGKLTVTSAGITSDADISVTVPVTPDSNHNSYEITATITPKDPAKGEVSEDTEKEADNFGGALLNMTPEEITGTILNEDDLKELDKGKSIRVWLSVLEEEPSSSVKETAESFVKAELNESYQILDWFDISLWKQIGSSAPVKVTETNNEITVDIDLSNAPELSGFYDYKVVHNYGSSFEFADAAVDANNHLIIHTDRFSYFALVGKGTYKVSFELNGHGSSIQDQFVKANSKASQPEEPIAAGYKFKGWYIDEACTKAWDFNTPISADTTLYAKWSRVSIVTAGVSSNARAEITSLNNILLDENGEYTFTARTIQGGYYIGRVKVDGVVVSGLQGAGTGNASYTFKNTDATKNHTVEFVIYDSKGTPATGDDSNVSVWGALSFLSFVSLLGIGVTQIRKKKTHC